MTSEFHSYLDGWRGNSIRRYLGFIDAHDEEKALGLDAGHAHDDANIGFLPGVQVVGAMDLWRVALLQHGHGQAQKSLHLIPLAVVRERDPVSKDLVAGILVDGEEIKLCRAHWGVRKHPAVFDGDLDLGGVERFL